MRLGQFSFLVGIVALAVCIGPPAQAESVPVGSSSLIGALDYSDTYTAYDFGGLEDRTGLNHYPLSSVDYPADGTPGEGLAVEDCHGNTPRSWSDGKFSISKDANPINGASVYPGGSGGGSATGMTQTGGSNAMWGIEYGLRDRFVVQYDAVQSTDWVGIGFGGRKDEVFVNENVTFLFRLASGHVGIYNQGTGEVNSGLVSPVVSANEWHNYAAAIDVAGRTAELFVDEESIGTIDFDTVGGGAMAGLALSNAAVNVGYWTWDGDRFWTDNFQVGAYVPEPGTVVFWVGGLAGLLAVGRRKDT